jgi:hypothetical protein
LDVVGFFGLEYDNELEGFTESGTAGSINPLYSLPYLNSHHQTTLNGETTTNSKSDSPALPWILKTKKNPSIPPIRVRHSQFDPIRLSQKAESIVHLFIAPAKAGFERF